MKINLKSISFRLLIGGITAVVIPIAVVGFYSVRQSSCALNEMAKGTAVQVAKDLSFSTNIEINNKINITQAMAGEPRVMAAALKVLENGLEASITEVTAVDGFLDNAYPMVGDSCEQIFVTDSKGNIFSDNTGGSLRENGVKLGDRDYFIKAMDGEVNVGAPVKSRISGNPVCVVAVPLKTASGRFAGMFGTIIKLDSLSDMITAVKIGKTGYPFMVDKQGVTISHPRKEFILKMDISKLEGMEAIVKDIQAGRSGIEDYVFKGIHKICAVEPVAATGWSIGVTQDKDEFQAASKSIRNSTILLGITAVLLAIILIRLFSRSVVTPINAAVAGLKDIAQGEGDLTMRLRASGKDETGELAKWFNVFIEKLQGIIREISHGVETLTTSSTELSTISDEMFQISQNTSEKCNVVATASEEMSSSMNTVAAAMEQSATNTNVIAVSAEEMSSTISEIAMNSEKARKISEQAATKASETSTKVSELNQSAQAIENVIETITDISEQVNLLALNATIEAARAGVSGKGFAVVACEIKELAKQTAVASRDIKGKIGGVQDHVRITIEQIEQITNVINEVDNVVAGIATAVEEQATVTAEIATNVSQSAQGIKEVNSNVNQSSAVAFEISKDIAEVNDSAGTISSNSSQVNGRSHDLSKLAEQLRVMVNQFKI